MGGRQGLEIGKLLRKLLLAGDSKGLLFIVIKITAVPRPPALGDEGGVHLGEGEGEGEGKGSHECTHPLQVSGLGL